MSKLALGLAAVLTCGLASAAEYNEQAYNQISFSTQASVEVENDEISAQLSKKAQAKTTKELAAIINPAISTALSIAKRYPGIEVSSTNINTYPVYSRGSKITGFSGQASIRIKSTNTEQAGQYISDVQSLLTIDDISFHVSSKKQEETEQKLIAEASKKFQNQAGQLASLWNAKSFKLVKVNLSGDSGYYRYPMAASLELKTSRSLENEGNTDPINLESGKTKMNYTIAGIIELEK